MALLRAPVIIHSMNRIAADTPGRRRRGTLTALALLTTATLVGAVDEIELQVERVEGAGWSAEGVVVRADLPEGASGVSATVSRLRLSSIKDELRDVRVECPALEFSTAVIRCTQARILAFLPSLGAQTLSGDVRYERTTGALDFDLRGLRVGQGQIDVAAALNDAGWRATAEISRLPLEETLKLAKQWQLPVPELTATGLMTASISAAGMDTALRAAAVTAKLTDLTGNNESGSLAADRLAFEVRAKLGRAGTHWRFDATVKSAAGQAYAQPIFLDLGVHPLEASARGLWKGGGLLTIDHFAIDHREVARGSGRGTIDLDAEQPLRALRFDLQALQFPGAYTSYFQPFLLDTGFKSLQMSGGLSGVLSIADGEPREASLRFDRVSLDDGARNFVLNDLSGEWHWLGAPAASSDDDDDSSVERSRDSMLSWASGTLLNLDLGASRLRFNTQGRQVRLLEPAHIPVLDGAIALESFRIRNAGMPTVAFMVDASIQPISVRQLCQAFGWPEFGGRIGGNISKLRMRERVVTLGTTLTAQVFDGEVRISDLRLEQPFGQWPRLRSNIALENLDLNLITSAFSFGGMTGRLSGSISGLELFNWTPVAFDARLFTPPGDRSRHRISQRAVENIGSIGGGGAGVTAALSSGVMRFFDEFNYDRLGVSCRLQQDVCHMDGVAPAPNGGYYLVKGKGLPRIDVIGSSRRVDWPRLVRQLIAITQSEGPVVQ